MIAAREDRASHRDRHHGVWSSVCAMGLATAGLVLAAVGCSQERSDQSLVAPYADSITIAVAPALNFSDSTAVDRVKLADLMASELSEWKGINVIGVNRVLAVLAQQGRQDVASPAHAIEICKQIGVDAILVFAVEEYDPYMPPVIRVSAQLYGPQPRAEGFDPIATSRQSRPFAVAEGGARELRPWSQVQETFNAAQERVQRDVEAYGRSRDAERSPMGWRKYLASQELFVRFCCHNVLKELMWAEQSRGLSEPIARAEMTP
jgi:hypothetical protein